MVFGQSQKAIPDAPAEGTEIAGVRLKPNLGEPVNETIEALFEEGEHLALASPILKRRHHVHLGLALQNLHHLAHQLRPLLQIRVDEGNVVPPGVLQPGVNARLLAEIPGEGDDLHRAGVRCVELFQVMQGGVPAAVVNIHNFVVIAAAVKGRYHRLLEGGYIFRLVVAGDDQGKLHTVHAHFKGIPAIIRTVLPFVKRIPTFY